MAGLQTPRLIPRFHTFGDTIKKWRMSKKNSYVLITLLPKHLASCSEQKIGLLIGLALMTCLSASLTQAQVLNGNQASLVAEQTLQPMPTRVKPPVIALPVEQLYVGREWGWCHPPREGITDTYINGVRVHYSYWRILEMSAWRPILLNGTPADFEK